MNTFKIVDSPIGGLVLVAGGGALAGLYHEYHEPEPSPVLLGTPFPPTQSAVHDTSAAATVDEDAVGKVFQETEEWLTAYFDGAVSKPPTYEAAGGTKFQRAVWGAVTDIPYGATRTYKEIAAQLGNDAMGRAVGAAVRANPLSILIPGHRVVGAGGAVTGYAAGVPVKRALLELEAAVLAQQAA